jgi:hypothetical protein
MMHNTNRHRNAAKDMTLEQKMFRKFFYENSSFIESETAFIEITDPALAKTVLGIENDREVVAVQNKNPFSSFNSRVFKT